VDFEHRHSIIIHYTILEIRRRWRGVDQRLCLFGVSGAGRGQLTWNTKSGFMSCRVNFVCGTACACRVFASSLRAVVPRFRVRAAGRRLKKKVSNTLSRPAGMRKIAEY
jgi:hypothetical protein